MSLVVGIQGQKAYLYLYRRVCVYVCVYPSDGIHVVACGPIGTKFCTHMYTDSSPNGSELNKNQPRVTQGGFGGF